MLISKKRMNLSTINVVATFLMNRTQRDNRLTLWCFTVQAFLIRSGRSPQNHNVLFYKYKKPNDDRTTTQIYKNSVKIQARFCPPGPIQLI